MKQLSIFIISQFICLFAFSQAGTLDPTLVPGIGPNASVTESCLMPDGKIVLVGDFTTYQGVSQNYVTRIQSNGSIDPAFSIGTGALGAVFACASQPDGKVLIGGNFTNFNGTIINRIARLNTDGSVDATFNIGTGAAGGVVYAIAVQPDGKIVVGGTFVGFNGVPVDRIVRLNANGTMDAGFNASVDGPIRDFAIESDGKIVLAGNFFSCNGVNRRAVAKLNTDGTIFNGFDPGVGPSGGTIRTVSVHSNGKVVVGGDFNLWNNYPTGYLIRLNAAGTVDTGFNLGDGFGNFVFTTAIQADGKTIVGGMFNSLSGIPTNYLTRLNLDGSIDNTWNTAGTGSSNEVYTSTLQPDGKVIIGGLFGSYNGVGRNYVARLSLCGTLSLPGTVTNTTCFNGTDGAINVTPSGGSHPYSYDWGSGITTEDLSGLSVGSYTLNAMDVNGCVAPATTYTVTQPPLITHSYTDTSCTGSYVWNTQTYTTSGAHTQSFTTVHGCDSIVTLNLSIYHPDSAMITISGCGEVTVNNQTYTQSGSYVQYLTTVHGCDSTLMLDVVIMQVPTVTLTQIDDVTLQVNAPGALTYQWIDCATNQPITGADSSVFVATQNGSYAVEVADSNCSVISSCVLIDHVGLSENHSGLLDLYPNPTSGSVTLNWKTPLEGAIRILDLTGKIVLVQSVSGKQSIVLELPGVKGVYLIEVNTGTNSEYFRVMKEF